MLDALGGVLCRCTGYRKIVAAVLTPWRAERAPCPARGRRGGRRPAAAPRRRREGRGHARNSAPTSARPARLRCAPSARRTTAPRSRLATSTAFVAAQSRHPARAHGARRARPQPLRRASARFADQPVFAEGEVRFRGEAVAAVVGEADGDREPSTFRDFPVAWEPLAALTTMSDALSGRGAPPARAPARQRAGARPRRARRCRGRLGRGGIVVVEGDFETGFVEHAADRAGGGLCPPRRRPHRGQGLHAVALHGPRRGRRDPRHLAAQRAHHADRRRRRLRRQARPLGAALRGPRRLAS